MVLITPTEKGRLRHASRVELRIGGAESNVAIALARLGFSVGWVSWLGDDELGELILHRIRGEGVDTSQVKRVEGAPTGLYLRERVGSTVRTYYYRSGSAASRMRPSAFDPEYLASAKILHLTGITPALSASCRAFTVWAIEEARRRNLMVSFDVNYRSRLWSPEDARAFVEQIAAYVDVLFVSSEEASVLWGDASPDLLWRLTALGPEEVILMQGAEGASALVNREVVTQEAYSVTEVDPIGAGDAFVAGYLAGKLWGLAPGKRLQVGCAMGAFSVMTLGDYEGLPSRGELWAFINGQKDLGR